MKDFDNEFSIDNILEAAKKNDTDTVSLPDEKPISSVKAPHALTPDEVVGKSVAHSDETTAAYTAPIEQEVHEFVVYENDIHPAEVALALNGDEVETPEPEPEALTEFELETGVQPEPEFVTDLNSAVAEPSDEPAYEPFSDDDLELTKFTSVFAELKKKKAENLTVEKAKAEIVSENSRPVTESLEVKSSIPEEIKQETMPVEPVKYEKSVKKATKQARDMSVEEMMQEAEARAQKRIKNSNTKYKPASYYSKNKETEKAEAEENSDEPYNGYDYFGISDTSFAPIKKSDIGEPSVVHIKHVDVTSNDKKGHSITTDATAVESFSSGVFSAKTMKVTPVKRSRVFITPSSEDISTPATKVVANEVSISVNRNADEQSDAETDNRIKEHNPYASQYSLADSEFSEHNKIFAADQLDSDDNIDIASSYEEDKTMEFNSLPADDKSESINATEEAPIAEFEADEDITPSNIDFEISITKTITKLIPAAAVTSLLLLLSTPIFISFREGNATLYSLINLVLLIIIAVLNYKIFPTLDELKTINSIEAVKSLRPNINTPVVVAVVAAFFQSFIALFAGGTSLAALGTMALCFYLVGKLIKTTTIKGNFKCVNDEDLKKSAFVIDEPSICKSLAGDSVDGDALIFSTRSIKKVKNFLRNSHTPEPYAKDLFRTLIIGFAAAFVAGIFGIISSGFVSGVTLLCAVLCICCPPSYLLLTCLPMFMANKRLNTLGAQITGFNSAKTLSDANAIIIDSNELFTQGSVKLFKMKVLAYNPIDRAILEAAAVAELAGSPLVDIFKGMIDDPTTKLPVVDTVVCEDMMGISGWMGEKRIFIGNRTLMEAHGIALPTLDVDKQALKSGYFPVYVANTEGPAALFIVGYSANDEISYNLRRLCATGTSIIVNSCDQNVNKDMICDYFELPKESVTVMTPQISNLYKSVALPIEEADCKASSPADASGVSALLTACIRIAEIFKISYLAHLAGMAIATLLIIILAVVGNVSVVSVLTVALFQILWSGGVAALSFIRKP